MGCSHLRCGSILRNAAQREPTPLAAPAVTDACPTILQEMYTEKPHSEQLSARLLLDAKSLQAATTRHTAPAVGTVRLVGCLIRSCHAPAISPIKRHIEAAPPHGSSAMTGPVPLDTVSSVSRRAEDNTVRYEAIPSSNVRRMAKRWSSPHSSPQRHGSEGRSRRPLQ